MTVTRSRYRVFPNETQKGILTWTKPDGSVVVTENTHNRLINQRESIVDTVTPSYRKKIAGGDIINNPLIYKKTYIKYGAGNASWLNSTGLHSYGYEGSLEIKFGAGPNHSTEPASRISAAPLMQRCLANVDATPYEMMEDVFELKQTLAFLKNPFRQILSYGRSFKRDVRKRMKRTGQTRARAKASLWLEYQFAVMPLVRSCYDIVESIGKEFEFPERRTARASRKVYDEGYSAASQYGKTWKLVSELDQDIRVGILYTVSNPAGEFRSTYGLRNKDIPTTLWQIVPLSFMIDRVINISDSIRGLVNLADSEVSMLAGWITKRTEVTFSNYLIDHPDNNFACSSGGKHTFEFTFTRETWDPSLTDTLPSLNLGGLVNSATKVIDLVALIVKAFK